MYAQQIENTWKELIGNIVFSPTIYQTAESLTDEQRQEFNVYLIEEAAIPSVSSTQKLGSIVYTLKDNVVEKSYTVIDKTSEEIAQETAYKALQVRAERRVKLAESDWTHLTDSTVNKTEWATYRQALRDITTQSGFPLTVEWPTPPGA